METVLQDYLRLSYRPDLHLLFMRWARPVSSAEHREGYHTALELAQEPQCGQWLIDLRARGLASPEDFAWILHPFRPLMGEALPAPRRIAYLVTPYQAGTINGRLTEMEPEVEAHVRNLVGICTFIEELPAQQWLRGGV